MKIRTDFVTNSSSSSFVAVLNLTLENGENVRAIAQDSIGDSDFIQLPRTKYRMDRIRSLDDLIGMMAEKNGEYSRIISGTLRLMVHAEGEYSYNANAEYMLPDKLGYEWGDVIKELKECHSEEQLLAKAKKFSFLEKYSVDSLRSIMHYFENWDDFDGNTEVIQTLNPDGTMTLKLEHGADFWIDDDGSSYNSYWNLPEIQFKDAEAQKEIQCAKSSQRDVEKKRLAEEARRQRIEYTGTGMTLEDLGNIKTILRIELSFDNAEETEEDIREWVSIKKYPINITHEDDIDTLFKKLGFAYEGVVSKDELIFETREFDCRKLCFPYSEFLSVILPHLYGGLIIVKAENMQEQPMSIVATQVSTLVIGSDGWSDRVEVEIREATDEDFEEGYPW